MLFLFRYIRDEGYSRDDASVTYYTSLYNLLGAVSIVRLYSMRERQFALEEILLEWDIFLHKMLKRLSINYYMDYIIGYITACHYVVKN